MKKDIMNNNITLLNEEELANISGGNYGDYDRDIESQSMYQIGQRVEVFTSGAHTTTKPAVIYSKRRVEDGHWWYSVEYFDGSGYDIVISANAFMR